MLKDLQDLVRGEIKLARTELTEDAKQAGRGIAMLAAGAIVGLVGFIFLALAATYALDTWLDNMWLSALIVAAVLVVIAAVLASIGKSRLSAGNLKPEQTIESLKEDQEWAKQQMNSVKR